MKNSNGGTLSRWRVLLAGKDGSQIEDVVEAAWDPEKVLSSEAGNASQAMRNSEARHPGFYIPVSSELIA